MRLSKTIFFLALLCAYTKVSAQLSTHEQPVSFDSKLKLTVLSKSSNPTLIMPSLDMAKIEAEDKVDEEYDMPPRFGYSHFVNYDLNNSGTWYELPNGDKLWQLEVVCPTALSVNFCYDKFWIPEGGKFFVYSKDKKHTIGAFTSKNNMLEKGKICGFATGLVYGNDVVLEYYQPKETSSDATISIEKIVHGYRYIRIYELGYGVSDSCMVNVNCYEGQKWQFEKKAVALIIVDGERWCTGSLINTTNLSQTPFFLTANHCVSPYGDASGNANLNTFCFYWDYEEPGCINYGVEPSHDKYTTRATIVANYAIPDFALLRLTNDPLNIFRDSVHYYLGWDMSGLSGDSCVCIHHPRGDVKKISTSLSQPHQGNYPDYSHDNWYWDVHWDETINGHGVVNQGSSGSPLLNNAHRIIGQLRRSNTEGCYYDGYSLFGKFSVSWTGNNIASDSIHKRLDCWLDSLNTGVQTMEGLLVIPSRYSISANDNQELYANIRVTSTGIFTIFGNVEMKGAGRVIVESGGELNIIGGKLSNVDLLLKPGAKLNITEGGILDIRTDFDAPEGATVFIDDGNFL